MLEHVVALPFWASILGAAFFYLAFSFLPHLLAGSSLTGEDFASVFPTLAPWAAMVILAAGLIGVGKRRWRGFLLSHATGLSELSQMSWPDFDLLVGEVYRQQGYSVTERRGRQADGG